MSSACARSACSDSRNSFSVSISSCLLTPSQAAALDLVARDDAELLEDEPQQIVLRQERVQHQRGERLPVDLLEQRAAERRLAGADVAGDDDEALAAADGVLQQLERVGVRRALVQVLGIGRQAERLFREPVIVLVHDYPPACYRLPATDDRLLTTVPARLRTPRARHDRRASAAAPRAPHASPPSATSFGRSSPEISTVWPSMTRVTVSTSVTRISGVDFMNPALDPRRARPTVRDAQLHDAVGGNLRHDRHRQRRPAGSRDVDHRRLVVQRRHIGRPQSR